VASPQDRAAVIARRRGLSAPEAATWAETTDRQRAGFVRRYFRQDVADPHHYDLVLNMSRLSLDEAADVITQTLRRLEARGLAAPSRPLEPVRP
jgi:cytidylate kinase